MRTIVLRKAKEWEILFPQLKDNTLPTSGGVNMLFQIKKAGDNATTAASFAERTQLLELSALQLHTDRETCSKA